MIGLIQESKKVYIFSDHTKKAHQMSVCMPVGLQIGQRDHRQRHLRFMVCGNHVKKSNVLVDKLVVDGQQTQVEIETQLDAFFGPLRHRHVCKHSRTTLGYPCEQT